MLVWLLSLAIVAPVSWWLQGDIGLASCFWTYGLNLFIVWYITNRLVAKEKSIPKMGTAWPGHIIATTILRMLLVLVLGGVLFAFKQDRLGPGYWIHLLVFYLVGLVLQTKSIYLLSRSPRANSV